MEGEMGDDFLHQLIEQAYAAAQSPAATTRLESPLDIVRGHRRYFARESMRQAGESHSVAFLPPLDTAV
jgi:hypothetical protein